MRALVTGAGGFVGEATVRHLLASGISVRAMVRKPEAAAPLAALGAETIIADLTDKEAMRKAVDGIDTIHHIAALFRQAGLPSSEFRRVNVEGTRTLLDLAQVAGVRSVVHCSTVGVLGHVETPPADEGCPYNPGDPYQESKAEGEQLFLQYVAEGRIRGNVIRPAMIYGPRDTRTLKLFKRIAERRFVYVGPGTSLVHFIDVRDLAESFRMLAGRSDLNGETFIIAGESSLELNRLVSFIASLMGVPEPSIHLPILPMQLLGDLCEAICKPLRIEPPIFRRRVDFFTKDRSFDCSKAERLLGFQPQRSLAEELVDIIDSYVASGQINPKLLSRPSVIVRSVDGNIVAWDDAAHRAYGWSREQAVGSVSHSLLATRFPERLEVINTEIHAKGIWKGKLIHVDREGNSLQVDSKWKLFNRRNKNPYVLEVNWTRNRTRTSGTTFEMLNSFGGLSAQLLCAGA